MEQGRKHHFTTGVGEVGVNNDNYVYKKLFAGNRRARQSGSCLVIKTQHK